MHVVSWHIALTRIYIVITHCYFIKYVVTVLMIGATETPGKHTAGYTEYEPS